MQDRRLPLGSLLLGLACFFLPFITVKCNDKPLMSITTFDYAIGNKPKMGEAAESLEKLSNSLDDLKNLGSSSESESDSDSDSESSAESEPAKDDKLSDAMEGKMNPLLVFSLIAALIGVYFSYEFLKMGSEPAAKFGSWAAGCAALGLIAARLILDSEMGNTGSETMGIISVEYGAGFYLPLIAFAGGAYLLYKHWNQAKSIAIEATSENLPTAGESPVESV